MKQMIHRGIKNQYVVGGSSVWYRVSSWAKCRDMCIGTSNDCKSFTWYGNDEKNMPPWEPKHNCKLMSAAITSPHAGHAGTQFAKSCCTVEHWNKECHTPVQIVKMVWSKTEPPVGNCTLTAQNSDK